MANLAEQMNKLASQLTDFNSTDYSAMSKMLLHDALIGVEIRKGQKTATDASASVLTVIGQRMMTGHAGVQEASKMLADTPAANELDYTQIRPAALFTLVYRGIAGVTSRYSQEGRQVDKLYTDALKQELHAKAAGLPTPLDIAQTKAEDQKQRGMIENLYALIHGENLDPKARSKEAFMTAPEKAEALSAAIAEIEKRRTVKAVNAK